MATSAATVLKIIESMVDARPKTVDTAIELLNGEGLLPAKLLTDRAKALVAADAPSKMDSRFASPYAHAFAVQNRIRIPEGFVGTGRDGTIKKPDLERLLAGVTVKDPKVPKAAKVPKEPKVPKASKVTKKVRELLHEWGLDESALEGIQPTAYNGAKFGVGDIAHLEPGLETGKTKKSPGKGKGKTAVPPSEGASSSSSRAAPPDDDSSDDSSDTTEEQDDEEEDFDPFKAFD